MEKTHAASVSQQSVAIRAHNVMCTSRRRVWKTDQREEPHSSQRMRTALAELVKFLSMYNQLNSNLVPGQLQ